MGDKLHWEITLHNFYKSYCLQGHSEIETIALKQKISIVRVDCECVVDTYTRRYMYIYTHIDRYVKNSSCIFSCVALICIQL